jgi:heptosyltransferase-2
MRIRPLPESVVVSMKGYLGDTVMATPLLSGLEELGLTVKVTAPPIVGDVLGQSWCDRFLNLGSRRGMAGLRAQVKAFRTQRPDAVILVNRSFRSALAAWLARVPLRVGHATEGRKALLTKSLEYDPSKAEISCYLELAGLLGHELPVWAAPSLGVSSEELAAGRQVLQRFPHPERVFALQPGARYAEKQLPVAVTVAVIERLRAAGYEPVLVGGPEESATAGEVQKQLDRPCADLVGQLPLRASLGLLANVRFAVGADTGLIHLAVAVGTPTVTVFGPNPASKWGHFFGSHRVLETSQGLMANTDLNQLVDAVLEVAALGRSPIKATTPQVLNAEGSHREGLSSGGSAATVR